MFEYRAVVLRVLDGDTIDVNIDLGFDVWRRERVRLAGIDAPELRDASGRTAAAFVSDLMPFGNPITIQTEKPYPHDKYGRYLATVGLADGRSLNNMLIEAGLALPYFGGAR